MGLLRTIINNLDGTWNYIVSQVAPGTAITGAIAGGIESLVNQADGTLMSMVETLQGAASAGIAATETNLTNAAAAAQNSLDTLHNAFANLSTTGQTGVSHAAAAAATTSAAQTNIANAASIAMLSGVQNEQSTLYPPSARMALLNTVVNFGSLPNGSIPAGFNVTTSSITPQFDAAFGLGVIASGTNYNTSWQHTFRSDANYLVVPVNVTVSAVTTIGVKLGTTSLVNLGSQSDGATTTSYLFGLAVTAGSLTGPQTITLTITSAATCTAAASSYSYINVGTHPTPVGTSGTGTALSETSTTVSGDMLIQMFSRIATATSGTQRSAAYTGYTLIEQTALGASTTVTATQSSSVTWAGLSVRLRPAAATAQIVNGAATVAGAIEPEAIIQYGTSTDTDDQIVSVTVSSVGSLGAVYLIGRSNSPTTTFIQAGVINAGAQSEAFILCQVAGVQTVLAVVTPFTFQAGTYTLYCGNSTGSRYFDLQLNGSTIVGGPIQDAGNVSSLGVSFRLSGFVLIYDETDGGSSPAVSQFTIADNTAVLTLPGLPQQVSTLLGSLSQSTSSNTYGDLSNTTDTVTVAIGSSGMAQVTISGLISSATAGDGGLISFALSGANTVSATDNYSVQFFSPSANALGGGSNTYILTGLTAGSTTFKMKYRSSANTVAASFSNRYIAVVPL